MVESKNVLENWEGILIEVHDDFIGYTHSVPGWRCRRCGAQYGSVKPPSECWKCKENDRI